MVNCSQDFRPGRISPVVHAGLCTTGRSVDAVARGQDVGHGTERLSDRVHTARVSCSRYDACSPRIRASLTIESEMQARYGQNPVIRPVRRP